MISISHCASVGREWIDTKISTSNMLLFTQDSAMQWVATADRLPNLDDMKQSDFVLVAYYPAPDTNLVVDIGYYSKDGIGSGWFQKEPWKSLPAPRYWAIIEYPQDNRRVS